jgi:hypothetical protein
MPESTMVSTADTLIYAIGGGHGHARRGWLVQRELARAGHEAVLVVRPRSDIHLPGGPGPRLHAESLADRRLLPLRRNPPPRLVVDTFPTGWQGELDHRFLASFSRRSLVARFANGLPSPPLAYDRLIAPYPASRCEWQGGLRAAVHAGYLVDATHVRVEPDDATCTVFDPAGRASPRLRQAFVRLAARAGLRCRFHDSLRDPLRAGKLVVIGAGYHTFYELLGRGLDVRFMPIRKRYDDQSRRAALFGLELRGLDEVFPWMAAEVRPVVEDVRIDSEAWRALVGD